MMQLVLTHIPLNQLQCIALWCLERHSLKAPLHATIRPHVACRLPCTWVNRNQIK